MLRKRGIKNEGNFCFLNSIMNCLANSIEFREPSDCEFQRYLFLTLQYIHECEETKNLYLFWVELRRRQPQLFQEQPDKQQPQDAYEALLYLLTEANLLDQFTILTNNPYCQIKEFKNILHLHKNWADESVYYVWKNKVKFQNIKLLFNLDQESELNLYKMIPGIEERIEWHKDEPFDFDLYTYHIEPQPKEYEILIEVYLQYVENDITMTLTRLRNLFLKEFQIKKSELYRKLRQLLDKTQIKFDVYGCQGYIEDNDQVWELISPLYLVFRTADYDQFQWCKQLNTPKQAINYQYQLQFDEPLKIDNPSQTLILVVQRIELIKNQNLYFLRENLIINERTYQLKSVCCHVGDAQNGHYVSYLKFGNQWEIWDDEIVELRNIDYQCMKACYILFYRIA